MLTAIAFTILLAGDHHHDHDRPRYHMGTPQERETNRHLEKIERSLEREERERRREHDLRNPRKEIEEESEDVYDD